jgi:hypothetical protein
MTKPTLQAIIIALFSILSLEVSLANTDKVRAFGVYLGGGLDRRFMNAELKPNNVKLDGWGAGLSGGVDLPFGDMFGLTVGGGYSQGELINGTPSSPFIELMQVRETEARAGVFISHLAAGGGLKQIDIKMQTFNGSTSTFQGNFTGNGYFGYANLSFDYRYFIRASLEAQYQQIPMGSLNQSEARIGIQIFILLNGKRP